MNILSFLGRLLPFRDWVYLLSLLVPFAVYDLTLKALTLLTQPGLALSLDLMRSDILFDLGYALLWIGLFAAARRGTLRRVILTLFHASTVLVVVVCASAYLYFKETGTTFDYNIVALWLPQLGEVKSVLTGVVPVSSWALLAGLLLYTTFGPWLLTRTVGRRPGWTGSVLVRGFQESEGSFLGSLGLCIMALGFLSFSFLIDFSPADASKSLARDPFVNVVLTGIEAEEDAQVPYAAGLKPGHPAAGAYLSSTPRTEKRNVVLVHLESTRSEATTPYNQNLETTPFLNQLAKTSLLAERAYTTVPHTSKATISVNCGFFPHLVQPPTEANPGGLPAPCLANLLKEQGYAGVLFQSTTKDFENFEGLVANLGYEDYYPLETMETEGFEWSNYFGYEDDIMLEPSERWLKEHKDKPFVAEYLTGTGHHDYRPPTRYGLKDFSEDDLTNRYLNSVRYLDFFVKNLFNQYKELGLYEDTIFVIFGDHGEGFGEHGRYQHDDTIYEEGLKVPLLIHAPGWFEDGERQKGLSNHTDILPTVLEMLGYEVKDGEYPGYSLLRPLPEDRTLTFSCFHEDKCLASIRGDEKYIHHYGNQPDEFFDLSEDLSERENLAGDRAEEVKQRREELLVWRSGINASYERAGGVE